MNVLLDSSSSQKKKYKYKKEFKKQNNNKYFYRQKKKFPHPYISFSFSLFVNFIANRTMSEPPTPRCTLTCPEKRQRNASFSVRSENAIDENEKSARKFFTTWRSACDKTKDKTRELLKRTLSWKGPECPEMVEPQEEQRIGRGGGWSVHVWSKYVLYRVSQFGLAS